jgi:RND family efflux transporter MFP subunit
MAPIASSSYSKPKSNRRFVWFLVIAAIAGGAWAIFGRHHTGNTGGAPSVVVRVAPVVHQTVPLSVQSVGTVVAYETVAVRSRLDSQIVAVNFHDGDEVKQGDVLFKLDDEALVAQAQQLRANIARDKANLENARRQYDRTQSLTAKGFATKANLDDARANLDAASANVGASQAALDNVNVQIGYTRITAPISGRTGTINVTLGNTVKANDTTFLVTINQVKPIRVQMALPQNMLDALRAAMQAGTVTVDAYKQDDNGSGKPIAQGKLDYIDNNVDQSTGTFACRAGFDNADEQLWPGMFVTISMTLGEDKAALTVPEVAVQHGQAGDYVYVIAEGKAHRREVKIARLQNNLAVIGSGLKEGESVATDGLIGLKEGIDVTIKSDASSTAAPHPGPAA